MGMGATCGPSHDDVGRAAEVVAAPHPHASSAMSRTSKRLLTRRAQEAPDRPSFDQAERNEGSE